MNRLCYFSRNPLVSEIYNLSFEKIYLSGKPDQRFYFIIKGLLQVDSPCSILPYNQSGFYFKLFFNIFNIFNN